MRIGSAKYLASTAMMLLLTGMAQSAIAQVPGSSDQPASQSVDPSELESPAEAAVETTAEGEGKDIVVTGSRIQRRDASAVGPLTTLTSQDIAFTAPTSVGDLLQSLPSVGVPGRSGP